MRLLNKLKAAPGQSNRALIRDFLCFKGWIKQEPEEWALYALPKDDEEYAALLNIIDQFERNRQEQAQADLREELI